jgi:uncharacterized protein with PQ loop repeat
MIKIIGSICGWAGMVLIQFATIPTIFKILTGTLKVAPPFDMVILIWAGLLLFLTRAILNKEWLYTISNAIGFITQSILLILIIDYDIFKI